MNWKKNTGEELLDKEKLEALKANLVGKMNKVVEEMNKLEEETQE